MLETVRLSLQMLTKPSQTYWELKYEDKGRMSVAFLLILLGIAMRMLWVYGTGFAFRGPTYVSTEWVPWSDEILMYVILWIVWTAANWGVSTLADGEGKLRDVAIASAYATVPLIVLTLPMVLLSNLLSLHELAFYQFVYFGSYVWVGYLLLVHVRTTHNYETFRAIGMALLTVFAVLLILVACILTYFLIGQIGVWASGIIREITVRRGL